METFGSMVLYFHNVFIYIYKKMVAEMFLESFFVWVVLYLPEHAKTCLGH